MYHGQSWWIWFVHTIWCTYMHLIEEIFLLSCLGKWIFLSWILLNLRQGVAVLSHCLVFNWHAASQKIRSKSHNHSSMGNSICSIISKVCNTADRDSWNFVILGGHFCAFLFTLREVHIQSWLSFWLWLFHQLFYVWQLFHCLRLFRDISWAIQEHFTIWINLIVLSWKGLMMAKNTLPPKGQWMWLELLLISRCLLFLPLLALY